MGSLHLSLIIGGVWLIGNEWVKLIAGLYLLYISIKELFFANKEEVDAKTWKTFSKSNFWGVVIQIEIMDIMFSIDSIAVALALSNKTWVLIAGAALGMLFMRMASGFFIKLIEKFPIVEKTAFVIVGLAGLNVVLKIKELSLDQWFSFEINKPIPENIFLSLIGIIFIGSILLNKFFPRLFEKKE
jgi:YkoY family integral membrane protein